MTVVELEHIVKAFGSTTALNDVSFSVDRKRIVSLLGPSGCGKTTTLRIIAGFEEPDAGCLTISNRSMQGLRPYERNVGLVFQDYALFPHMTVAGNVGYGMRHRGMSRSSIPGRISHYLGLVRMSDMADRYPRQLSGGQQQRVALARALSTEPEVLLLDEPLAALDAKLRVELQVELKEILGETGSTVIIVTHDQEEAMSLGDEVIVMNGGEIVQRGTPAEIYDRPASRFVAEFVGRSNWFVGRLFESGTPGIQVMRTDDGLDLRVSGTPTSVAAQEVCIRPERIWIDQDGARDHYGSNDVNRFSAVVRDVTYLGPGINVYVELSNGRRVLIVEQNRGVRVSVNDRIRVGFLPTDCHIISQRHIADVRNTSAVTCPVVGDKSVSSEPKPG